METLPPESMDSGSDSDSKETLPPPELLLPDDDNGLTIDELLKPPSKRRRAGRDFFRLRASSAGPSGGPSGGALNGGCAPDLRVHARAKTCTWS